MNDEEKPKVIAEDSDVMGDEKISSDEAETSDETTAVDAESTSEEYKVTVKNNSADATPSANEIGIVDSDTTVGDHPNESLGFPQSKKHHVRKPFVLLAVLGILFAGALAGLVWYFTQPTKVDKALLVVPITKTPDTSEQELAAKGLVENIKPLLEGEVTMPANFSAPSMELEGYEYAVRPELAYSVTANSTKAIMEKNLAAVDTYLRDLDYKKKISTAATDDSAVFDATYIGTEAVCHVYNSTPYPEDPLKTRYWTTVVCADVVTAQKTAETLKPFGEAYKMSESGGDLAGLTFGEPSIEDSTVEGYQRATISVSSEETGFAALFYKIPDGEWQYFRGVQSIMDCSLYNTTDIKNAYAGQACMSGQTESKVTP